MARRLEVVPSSVVPRSPTWPSRASDAHAPLRACYRTIVSHTVDCAARMRHWDGRVERVAGTVDGDTIDTLASEFVPRQLKAAVRVYTDALYKASHEQVSIAWYTPARLRPCVGRVGTMLYALHVLRSIATTDTSTPRPMRVRFIDFPVPKRVPPPPSDDARLVIWTPDHVNTGCCYQGDPWSPMVWRREECVKTCLHEMLHGLGADVEVNHNDRGRWRRWLGERFRVDADAYPFLISESVVETKATLLNLICFCDDEQAFVEAVARERHFVTWQCAKILHCSRLRSWEVFARIGAPRADADALIHQRTNLISYFLVKAAYLWSLDWFLRWFPLHQLPSRVAPPSITVWQQHLEAVLIRDAAFGREIDWFIAAIEAANNNNDATTRSALDTMSAVTMRMTCHEGSLMRLGGGGGGGSSGRRRTRRRTRHAVRTRGRGGRRRFTNHLSERFLRNFG